EFENANGLRNAVLGDSEVVLRQPRDRFSVLVRDGYGLDDKLSADRYGEGGLLVLREERNERGQNTDCDNGHRSQQVLQGSDQWLNSQFPILIRADNRGKGFCSDENWELRIEPLVRSYHPQNRILSDGCNVRIAF